MENKIEEKIEKHIGESVKRFYGEIKKDGNHRYKSWEHCYKVFQEYFKKDLLSDTDLDILSLNLAFYLASWGMLRNSFLLQKDYKIYITVIPIIFKYKGLNIFSPEKFNEDLKELNKELDDVFYTIKTGKKENFENKEITDTLKTKIILGTLGITPAYDRFFKDGIKYYQKLPDINFLVQSYNINGMSKLIDFIELFKKSFENIQDELDLAIRYPIMKILDMYFWQIGYEISLLSSEMKNKWKYNGHSDKVPEPKLVSNISFPEIELIMEDAKTKFFGKLNEKLESSFIFKEKQ